MDDAWKSLQLTAEETLDALWYGFAKEGRESEALAPLAQFPNASAWLVKSLAQRTDWKTRKLAAMLAGWIQNPNHISTLSEMLDAERKVFRVDSLNANSVGEDMMFAATRWTASENLHVRNAGIDILAGMIADSLDVIQWNTVHWAVANLHRATGGNHVVFRRLSGITEEQLRGQKFFWNAVKALQQNDQATLNRLVTPPSAHQTLPSDDPNYSIVCTLWNAAASAEATQ